MGGRRRSRGAQREAAAFAVVAVPYVFAQLVLLAGTSGVVAVALALAVSAWLAFLVAAAATWDRWSWFDGRLLGVVTLLPYVVLVDLVAERAGRSMSGRLLASCLPLMVAFFIFGYRASGSRS